MIPLPSEFKKHKKFSITELYLMNLFQDKFYNNDKFDGVLKSCKYYVAKSDNYFFGNRRIDCDFRDRGIIDFKCDICSRVINAMYKESNYTLSMPMTSLSTLTCNEYLIKSIIK